MSAAGRVVVVGGGSWGSAFARLVALHGDAVTLVCRTSGQAAEMAATRRNAAYLPQLSLPPSVQVTALQDPAALAGAGLVVLALPSRAVPEAGAWLTPRLPAGCGVLSLTKGLEPGTGRRLSDAWAALLPPGTPFAVLSGPNHAEEVALGQPCAAVVAGEPDLCARVQDLLTGPRFRVYVNGDLLGVEVCAAAKNVIAVAAGMSDGLGFGDNAKAALLTRGLAEMTRLGTALGASAATFRGLAGMGDLVATCTSRHSRNRMAGELMAQGVPAAEIEGRLHQVVEGLATVGGLLARADEAGVELPISREVERAAFAGRPAAECLASLMSRAPAAEE
ncbi:MAG: NAD(P)-dependent glycerol-3-phosphate dehydrogenase [Thermoleophilia bacterium]|nr:NAD(P)-dependent glycerol-3-phosphate dehydrogenase [Thermoleophilia bacterium]